MDLFTPEQYRQLLKNGDLANGEKDPYPAVKLVTPDASAIWLIIEIDPDDENIAYGLCHLGFGVLPEMEPIFLPEIRYLRGRVE